MLENSDDTGIRDVVRDSNSGPEKMLPNLTQMLKDQKSTNVIPHTGPASLKHSTYEARLRTFNKWTSHLKQEPKELAEAGFYYIGEFDIN